MNRCGRHGPVRVFASSASGRASIMTRCPKRWGIRNVRTRHLEERMSNRPLAANPLEKWLAALHFRPLPFLKNPHVQTVLGALAPGADCPWPDARRIVRLADGDALVLHNNTPAGWKEGDPLVLLVHGLSGSHRSPHIRRLAALFLARRARVVRMDLRGAGHGLPLARRCYHAGRSDDVR